MSEPIATLGMRGCPVADVFFDRTIVPKDAMVADADEALDRVARWARGPAVAISAGVLARSLETASEYARARIQGGGPIVDHHEVRRLLAGLMADLAFCRDAMHRLCGEAPEPEASLAFAEAKRRAAHATVDGVQILGGNGYMEDYFQERGMRDAKQAQALFGRADLCVQAAMGAWAEGGA
jgi:alkylation response protein AidB-like acyl-CoA dehydrogenase